MNRLKNIASIALGCTLLYILVHYLEQTGRTEEIEILRSFDLAVSAIMLAICFITTGIQLRLALLRTEQARLSVADTVALPITQNFWGHIIPFQGSFIYAATFLKAKYNADVSMTISIGLFITVCSVVVGALVGSIHSLYHDAELVPFYLSLVLLPLWLLVIKSIFMRLTPKWAIFQRAHYSVGQVFKGMSMMARQPDFLFKVIVLDTCFVFTYAGWSYYLSEALALDVPFIVFVLVAYMTKLTQIVKLTPGNVGVTQFFTGGILSLYGHPPEAGLLISTVQLGLLILLSFPLAAVLSLFQFRHIKDIFSRS